VPPSQPSRRGLPFDSSDGTSARRLAILAAMDDRRRQLLDELRQALNGETSLDRSMESAHPEVVFDWSRSMAPYRAVVHGHEAGRDYLRDFREAWTDVSWTYDAIEELPDGSLIVGTHLRATGAGGGVAVDGRGAQLVAFRDGLISELTLFQETGDALAYARHRERSARLAAARLYFVCEGLPNGEDPSTLLEAAIEGGVDVIQLREKAPRCAEEILAFAEPFARAARRHGVLFFLNDEPELVSRAGADGVHVGQDDAPVAEARELAGPGALVGLSTHSPEQFDAALAAQGDARPDQLSAGPVWATPTKPGRPAAGLELIRHAAGTGTDAPWFAIGGIDAGNVGEVVEAGATRAVVVREIRDAADPAAAARGLRAALPAANRET
jgi:thiamine-phosphate pyrophosphorylase